MNSQLQKIILSLLVTPSLCIAMLLLCAAPASAIPTTFQVKLKIDLCPEYKLGGRKLELYYTVGSETKLRELKVLKKAIYASDTKATVIARLPATFGTLPMNIVSFCKDAAHGLSAPSNVASVSNCDALALLDTDHDGIPNNEEDTNCDNFFSPGDRSNPDNFDTDGDGVRDLVEKVSGTDPTNPGSSPRPFIYESAPFDPDGDHTSNPVAWRPSNGTWYIKDFGTPGVNQAIQFGLTGDVPFTYQPDGATSDIGVIRQSSSSTDLIWYFHGPGFLNSNGTRSTERAFGIFGDNIILGPWERAGVTSPAVARLFNNYWAFYILQRDGTVRYEVLGGNGDIPRVQDYDGDGLFDIAVFRPSNLTTYVMRSSDHQLKTYRFGSTTADDTVRGDYTGDGKDDISFWEPLTGMFTALKSDHGFNAAGAASHDSKYYKELQLGLYYVHVPMSWNMIGGKLHYTVVDHQTGYRFFRRLNKSSNPVEQIQWGLAGDSLG